ncbi:hypothetical protein CK501_11130 [Halovibrio salipaludis]|uniref:Uncharacterized protein n=2 Tax=Halovibrio salipaludis TaxID=2032626 RepID=A0A2A2F424_9GAMM|nr:hypothetical protein CK501_11130 [Halovibrio salipaludis]
MGFLSTRKYFDFIDSYTALTDNEWIEYKQFYAALTMHIALFGYSHFTRNCAEALKSLGHDLTLYCPRGDQNFFEQAGMASVGLPVVWFEGMADPALAQTLEAQAPELILTVIFNHRIPESITQQASLGALNVHPAPLPSVRTAAVWFWPLRLGLTRSEVCIHHLTPTLDAGPVILRFPFRLHPAETQGTLTRRLNTLAPKVMQQLDHMLSENSLPEGEPQGPGQTYPSLQAADLWVDFSEPSESVRNLVRACTPYHAAQTRFRGNTLAIHELGEQAAALSPDSTPGQLQVGDDLWVCCGDGLLPVAVVAVPGEGVFSGKRFAALFDVRDGEVLGGT